MKLSGAAKRMLSDLIIHYLPQKSEKKIFITDDGGLVVSNGGLLGRISGQKSDFLTVMQTILEKINSEKDLKYIKSLSARAITSLVLSGDREKAVKLMFIAHLTEDAPSAGEVDDFTDVVDIPVYTGREEKSIVKVDISRNLGHILAEMLNNNDHIIFQEK